MSNQSEAEKHEVSQEPVAWIHKQTGVITTGWSFDKDLFDPLYDHPQPKQEPLLVFAQECVLGAYRESELADAAQRAIKAAHGITSDMKQEHVDKTAKQRHKENT